MSLANAPRDDVSDVRARPLEPAAPEAGRRGPAPPIDLEATAPPGDGPPPAGAVRPTARS